MIKVEDILEGLGMPLDFVMNNPDKRIYWLYLLSAVLLTLFVYLRHYRKEKLLDYLLDKDTWLSKSTWVDCCFVFFNSVFKVVVIGPFLVTALKLSFEFNEWLMETFGYRKEGWSKASVLIGYTVTLTLLNDLTTYLVHWMQHRIPMLWEFHKVHHSASSLNPLTQYRIHPVELIINNVRGVVVYGVCMGLFEYLAAGKVETLTFMGVNVFSFVFLFWGANLRHSHVRLTYFKWLEHILISPFQHQIHHSKADEHLDKNMGSKLAIWDWMFGTLVISDQLEQLEVGIDDKQVGADSFLSNLLRPFRNVAKRFLLIFVKK